MMKELVIYSEDVMIYIKKTLECEELKKQIEESNYGKEESANS